MFTVHFTVLVFVISLKLCVVLCCTNIYAIIHHLLDRFCHFRRTYWILSHITSFHLIITFWFLFWGILFITLQLIIIAGIAKLTTPTVVQFTVLRIRLTVQILLRKRADQNQLCAIILCIRVQRWLPSGYEYSRVCARWRIYIILRMFLIIITCERHSVAYLFVYKRGCTVLYCLSTHSRSLRLCVIEQRAYRSERVTCAIQLTVPCAEWQATVARSSSTQIRDSRKERSSN